MTQQELRLLERVIDSLDDLFDRKITVVSVHAIIHSTCEGMKGSEFAEKAQPILPELMRIIRSQESAELQRDQALGATDDLRLFISRALP